jgi:hypothetical protein
MFVGQGLGVGGSEGLFLCEETFGFVKRLQRARTERRERGESVGKFNIRSSRA